MRITGFYVHNGQDVNLSIGKKVAGAAVTLVLLTPEPVYAKSISESMAPIISVLKDLAEPISYGFMIKGFMKVMSGDEHEGIKTIKNAVGGFIGIQWIPFIFRTIKGIQF